MDVILGRLVLGSMDSSAVASCDNGSNVVAIIDWARNDLRWRKDELSSCLDAFSAIDVGVSRRDPEAARNNGICLVDGANAWLP